MRRNKRRGAEEADENAVGTGKQELKKRHDHTDGGGDKCSMSERHTSSLPFSM